MTKYYITRIICNHADSCCYYYDGVPRNVTELSCNPKGRIVVWECPVYRPSRQSSNLTVSWYKGPTNISTREQGELISQIDGKYEFFISERSTAINDSNSIVNGLFLDIFSLRIYNFNSSIDGNYYWCQMMMDGCYLQPSAMGLINSNTSNEYYCDKYIYLDLGQYDIQPVCAGVTSCMRTEVPSKSTASEVTTSTSAEIELSNQTSESTTTPSTFTLLLSVTLIQHIVIGALLLIVVLLLCVIMACSVNTARMKRKYNKSKQKGIYC